MTDRPEYKNHPLWNDAMALTREAYRIADRVRSMSPEISRRLRKAAVSVPAHVASALCAPEKRVEHMLAARGALAELSRQALGAGTDGSDAVAQRAEDLDRLILFEFGAAEVVS
jgi:four helix bundle protein